jgi:hypothetical protein
MIRHSIRPISINILFAIRQFEKFAWRVFDSSAIATCCAHKRSEGSDVSPSDSCRFPPARLHSRSSRFTRVRELYWIVNVRVIEPPTRSGFMSTVIVCVPGVNAQDAQFPLP